MTTSDLFAVVVSVVTAIVSLGSLLIKARQDRRREPVDAAQTLTSATVSLSEAFERRLAELEELTTAQATEIKALSDKVRELEQIERRLLLALRCLGLQVEGAGLSPCVDWREMYMHINGKVEVPQNGE